MPIMTGLHAHQPMRYNRFDRLEGEVYVKSRLFGARLRYVRLENNIITIQQLEDDFADPLATYYVPDTLSVTMNPVKGAVTLTFKRKSPLTLVFKNDLSLMQLWGREIRRAGQNTLSHYYKLVQVIGEGGYAKVHKAIDRKTSEVVAVKEIKKKLSDPIAKHYPEREAEIVRIVKHDNIVKTIDVFETPTHLYIVMEYLRGGDLQKWLAGGKNRVNERNALRFAGQLLKAVDHLHSLDVVHRDLKPENILLTAEGQIKIADFGLSRVAAHIGRGGLDLTSIVGSPAFCSPEILSARPYGKKVDMWGCGVLLYYTLSGTLPFLGKDHKEVFNKIRSGKAQFPANRWRHVSPAAVDLVKRLLSIDPKARPTAAQALRHPWLRSVANRPISPRPFVRNQSARASRAERPTASAYRSAVQTSRVSLNERPAPAGHRGVAHGAFRRTASGSLRQLGMEQDRKRRTGDAASVY